MKKNHYAGWESLSAEAKTLGEKFGVQVYIQPKEGYLRVSALPSAPPDLMRLLDEIEQRSSNVCQFCGQPGPVERMRNQWSYVVCPSSTWVSFLDGGVTASCGLKGASSNATCRSS